MWYLLYLLKCMTQDRRTQDTTQEATSSYQTVYRTPLINAQCQSIPINADQNSGIDPKYLSIKINSDQYPSFLIGIGINSTILISFDRHWGLIGGVLSVGNVQNKNQCHNLCQGCKVPIPRGVGVRHFLVLNQAVSCKHAILTLIFQKVPPPPLSCTIANFPETIDLILKNVQNTLFFSNDWLFFSHILSNVEFWVRSSQMSLWALASLENVSVRLIGLDLTQISTLLASKVKILSKVENTRPYSNDRKIIGHLKK